LTRPSELHDAVFDAAHELERHVARRVRAFLDEGELLGPPEAVGLDADDDAQRLAGSAEQAVAHESFVGFS